LRLDSTAGHPFEIKANILLPSSKSSWVTVNRVCPLKGSSTKVTREARSSGRSL
jgi:hypothetical protein